MSETKKIGIEQLIGLSVAISAFTGVVDDVFADKEVSPKDIVHLPALLSALKLTASVDFKAILPELNDLDNDEKLVLAQTFKDQFNIASDSLEESIELGFSVILEAVQAFQIVKSIGARIKG